MRQSAKQTEAAAERSAALDKLRSLLPPGSTVYCILRHVSRSGMQRVIDPLIFDPEDGRPFYLRGWMRDLGFRVDSKRDAIVVNGCGMDMGWHLVFNLSARLYPDGFGCIGDLRGRACPSNDHSNGDRDYTPHGAIGGCMERICACHDPGSWRDPRAYPHGCSRCGCHRVEHWHREGSYALRMEWL